jgi:uncharacterized protein YbjT (DUF2867 family)
VARVLIVGCGCRGRGLARELADAGHVVRGTTRRPSRREAIAAAGAEPFVGDPDRVGSMVDALAGVAIVCWLLGGDAAAELHGPRLRSFYEQVVDTGVRGVVYEPAGMVAPDVRARGLEITHAASQTWAIPLEVLDADPRDRAGWLRAARGAVDRLLAPG